MKKLLILSLAVILAFNMAACGKKDNADISDKKTETSVDNSVNSQSSEESAVKIEDNKIFNTVEDEDGSVTVQEYVYDDNDTLSEINVTIKLENEEKAKEMYDSIKSGDLKEEYESKYDNIELNGDCISADMKEENVEPMKALNQEQLYLILNSSITTYHVE